MAHRGVWKCPFLGPHGETYLYAVAAHGACLIDPIAVPLGSDADVVAESLNILLDQADPNPLPSTAGSAPLFTRRAVRHIDRSKGLRIISDAS